jgi:hypothetical protein
MRRRGGWAAATAAYALLFGLAVILAQWRAGAFGADRGLTADEAAHFVSSAMIADFLRGGAWTRPMAFVIDYYAHLPRMAIGHWPPLFHLIQGLIFVVTGPSVAIALLVQAVIAGLACAVPAALCRDRLGWAAGFAAGLLVVASPNFLFLTGAVMLDNLTGLMVLLCTLTWADYAERPSGGRAVLLAAAAIAALMTKGNALGLVFLPVIHCAVTRRWILLVRPATLAAAAAVASVVLPWYLLTYHLSAAGFNYALGWDYSSRAVPAYADFFWRMIGLPAAAAVLISLWRRLGKGRDDPVLCACASALIATLAFQMIAPADLQPRYLIAILPLAAILAIDGLALASFRVPRWRTAILVGAALISIAGVARLPRSSSFGTGLLARAVEQSEAPNPLILLCLSPTGEGAAIASFAADEPEPRHYLVRASQALSTSGFMGGDYHLLVSSPDEVGRWLAEHQIGWLILEESEAARLWPHNVLVAQAAERAGWRPQARIERAEGAIVLYRLPASQVTPVDVDWVRRQRGGSE